MSISSDPVLQLFAISSGVIVLSLYGLGFETARKRNERKLVINAEDSSINGGAKVGDAEHPDVARIKRAHTNAIENAVPFFILGFLFTMTDPNLWLARVLFGTFVLIRVLHALFYLNAKQPFRTASFTVGALVNLALLEEVVRHALTA